MSTGIYELNKSHIITFYEKRVEDDNCNLKIKISNIFGKTKACVETQIEVNDKNQKGCEQPKFTITPILITNVQRCVNLPLTTNDTYRAQSRVEAKKIESESRLAHVPFHTDVSRGSFLNMLKFSLVVVPEAIQKW